jgi:dihydropteroate synthase-like protein
MKVVIVTGGLMQSQVREVAERLGHKVFVAPVDIASFVKLEHLKRFVGFDLILFPGYCTIDLEAAEEITGVKTARGPKDVANLKFVLENLKSITLSKSVPACELLKTKLREAALSEIKRVDSKNERNRLLKRQGNFLIGSVGVGPDFPMRVIAEIVSADKLTDEDVLAKAKYYIKEGADIIDIGISKSVSTRVKELIQLLRHLNVPLSVDSMEAENIIAAIESGVDLILSLDEELLKKIKPTDTPVVIVPGKEKFERFNDRLVALNENIKLAKDRGFSNIVVDPILEPIGYGLADSINVYSELGKKGEIPLLMGVGNLTELTDADSIGINAILAGIAMECCVSLLFTTEASDKTRGSVGELKMASNMMFLAKSRGTIPKDRGIDLLTFKEKRRALMSPPTKTKRMKAKTGVKKQDSLGDFTIHLETDKIVAVHSKNGRFDVAVEGTSARDICDTILRLRLVADMGHASYLGRELEKAETALRMRRSYKQDESLF